MNLYPMFMEGGETKKSKKWLNLLSWIFWWKIDKNTLNEQVKYYKKLKITQSARGISFLWLIFSSAYTTFVILVGGETYWVYIDVVIFLTLGYLIFKGYKWASIGAMIVWTLEKGYLIYTSPSHAFTQIIFWIIYMHYFYLAYKIEISRRVIET